MDGWTVQASFVVVVGALLAALSGCEGGDKKAALTPAEIQRLTFAQKPNRPDELIVSGEPVTCEEITTSPSAVNAEEDTFRQDLVAMAKVVTLEQFLQLPQSRMRLRQRLNGRITRIVLYERAKRELGDKADEQLDKLAEKELRQFILSQGGNGAVADEALQKMGMNRVRFKEDKKRDILNEYYVRSKFPYSRPVTHSELLEYYEAMKGEEFFQPGLLQFRLIDIKVEEVELTDPNDDPTEIARDLAGEVMTKLRDGEDFADLAKEYSHGHHAADGGLWPPRNPEALARPYDVLVNEAGQTEPGQVTGPIEVPGRFFIVKMEQNQEEGYQPLSDVQDTVEKRIMGDREREVLSELDAEVAQQAAAANTDLFIDHCLERLYLAVNQPTEAQ